jgi:methionine synthase I (cobalamin-dependent)
MGTRLIEHGLDYEHDDPTVWNLSHPGLISNLHATDIEAGSQLILTNTFGANTDWLARFGRAAQASAIIESAVRIARQAAGPFVKVLGSIGPTASSSAVLIEQAERLLESGVDGLMLETFTCEAGLNALRTLRTRSEVPIFLGLIDAFETVDAFVDAGADAVGINCVDPVNATERLLALPIPSQVPRFWKPGAAHPQHGAIAPGAFAAYLPGLLKAGVVGFGGCCGSTSEHIAALRRALEASA